MVPWPPTQAGQRCLSAALLACLAGVIQAFDVPTQFLIISSPSEGNVYYAKLPTMHEQAQFLTDRLPTQAYVLIRGKDQCVGYGCASDTNLGLRSPRGLA